MNKNHTLLLLAILSIFGLVSIWLLNVPHSLRIILIIGDLAIVPLAAITDICFQAQEYIDKWREKHYKESAPLLTQQIKPQQLRLRVIEGKERAERRFI